MKKFSIKNICCIIPVLLALISGVFLFNNTASTSAETLTSLPAYFSVYTTKYKEITDEGGVGTGVWGYSEDASDMSTDAFANGDAIFLQSNQAIILKFDKNKLLMDDGVTYRISQEVTYTISINGKTLSTTLIENGFHFPDNTEFFKLAINPSVAAEGEFVYGKYSITLSYWYLNDNYDAIPTSFTCNFFVLEHANYLGTSTKTFATAKYNEAYFYNYNGKNSDVPEANLFTFKYKYKYFNLSINKVYQQLSYSTDITYNGTLNITNTDETGSTSAQNYVDITLDPNNSDYAIITFNDLGVYYISYQTINPYYNYEAFDQYFNTATLPNTGDTVYVYGYQAFYTSNNTLVEFKNRDEQKAYKVNAFTDVAEGKKALKQADVSYLKSATDNPIYKSDGTIDETVFNNIKNNLKTADGSAYNIVSTNQAPIYFNTNATVNTQESAVFYFANADKLSTLPTSEYSTATAEHYITKSYTCSPLSNAGIYLVQLAYTYDRYNGGTQYQYFMFEITNDSPQVEVVEQISDGAGNMVDGAQVPNDYFTYLDVKVKKAESGIFDSPSTLTVYKSTNFNVSATNFTEKVVVENEATFSESAKYMVELSYGNSNQKKYITYFTIDKTGIQDVTLSSAINTSSTLYSRGNILNNFLTNGAVALAWNNKEAQGKAQTYAEYKYFPTSISSTFASSLTSDTLKTYYSSPYTTYGIPSTHTFAYANGELPVASYANTYGMSVLSSSNVLAGSGMYIIKIYDQTALSHEVDGVNVKYVVVFIDKTQTSIITSQADVWSFATDAKTVSTDYSLYFGKYKLIQFEKMATTGIDSWLSSKVLSASEYSNYFVTYKDKTYLKVNTDTTVYYTVNSDTVATLTLSANNNFAITLRAMNGTTPNENQYEFFAISNSNSNINHSFEYYKSNYNARHQVTFSTDNSNLTLQYTNAEGNLYNLQQFSVNKSGTAKYNYYQPTNAKTLANSNEILTFLYSTTPTATLTVEKITMEYYDFSEKSFTQEVFGNALTTGTYTFADTATTTLTIYEKDGANVGTSLGDSAGSYAWQLNTESYNVSASQTSMRTKAGKYVITRTYTSSSTEDSNDPKTRVLTFIVDRNGIVSAPSIDSNGNKIYFAGEAIKLQVLNNYQSINSKTLFFQDIYFASQMTQNSHTASPVLITNLLPVTVYVPAYKYGYAVFDTNTYSFEPDKGTLTWKHANDKSVTTNNSAYYNMSYYSGYQLTAKVEYRLTENLLLEPAETFNLNKVLDNNFLTTAEGTGLLAFSKEGYYRVVISSNSGDTFNFDFQIKYAPPEYQLLDTQNNSLNKDANGVYYTNKSTVRIAWQDSESEFLAHINQDAISYKVENGPEGTINPSKIVTTGNNSYYVDLNLSEINSYSSNTKLSITLQFNGNKTDYNNEYYFSKTTSVIVDLDAPLTNINNLIKQTGLSFNNLREYYSPETNANKYNMSKQSGLFKHFSYVIDVSDFDFTNLTTSLIKTPAQTNYDYYKAYYRVFDSAGVNTKYVLSGVTQESEIFLDNYNDANTNVLYTSKYTFADFAKVGSEVYSVGKYVELIEEDYAGNRTVYTIYIADIKNSDNTAFTYTSLTTASDDTSKEVSYKDLADSVNLYSKYALSLQSLNLLNGGEYLGERYYQVIKVGDNTFVKTPYSNGKYYNVLGYVSEDASTAYSLEQITSLSSNANAQQIIFYCVPAFGSVQVNAYVLNKVLEYYTLAQYDGNQNAEGIVIRLPDENSSEENIIYALGLNVQSVISGVANKPYAITGEYLKTQQNDYKSQDYKITYIKGGNNQTYMRFEVTRNINKNDYFIYTFTDNFGEEYKVIHIYGQIEIANPITSDGDIITSYNEDGSYVYYSAENITYRFDTTIYSKPVEITFTRGGKSDVYRITKVGATLLVEIYVPATQTAEAYFKEITAEEYSMYFECTLYSGSLMAIEMKQEILNPSNGGYGNSYSFAVKLALNDDFGSDTDTKYFTIYNKIPKISLLGENGENVTSILGNKGVYTNSLYINYEQTALDCPYELYLITPDGTVLVLTEEYLAKDNGIYKIVVNYLGDLRGISKTLSFTIRNDSTYKYSVMRINDDGSYTEVTATGREYSYTFTSGANVVTKTEQIHYIVNSDYTILVNDSLDLIGESEPVEIVDEYTKIYVVHTDYLNTNLTEYYSVRFAVTQLPEVYSLFKENDFVEYDSTGNSSDLTAFTSTISPVVTKDGYEIGRKIAWSKYYLIPENLITAEIYYGEIGGTEFHPTVVDAGDKFAVTLKTSGVYYFKFTDTAGNSHFFGAYSDTEYFSIKYLSSVIFEINDETPINYAIYDKPVTVSVPTYTLGYYDANARPIINVELNGEVLKVENSHDYIWTFSEAGLYKITFSAKIAEESIYEPPMYFTVLSSTESRSVFSYTSFGEYYIEDILLNGKSVNAKLANANSGTLHNNSYLKDLTLHINDTKTGEGVWKFVINTNNDFEQKFEFSVWLNRAVVPIVVSHQSGTSTHDNITIKFTTQNLLAEAGDCIIKISGNEDLYITQTLYESGLLEDAYELTLDKTLEYYIEVTTLSGQLLFSSYIVKTEPLNTISIIIIIVAAILFVAFVVVFTLVRKKMRIK